MVEGTDPFGSSYVDETSFEFNGSQDPYANNDENDPLDPREAVNLEPGSGQSGANSNHAFGVAKHFFGDATSIAPGVNDAVIYEAGNWLVNALHYDMNGGFDNGLEPEPPRLNAASDDYMVQNHSYIVTSLGNASRDQSALRRLDWVVENYDVTEVVGANNVSAFTNATHPSLWAHSFNAIVVGRSDGFHSRGSTGAVYRSGRVRPDIVAPFNLASHAAPVVGSTAALLHETATSPEAVRSETIKATLLAGATKQEFANFVETLPPAIAVPPSLAPKPWDRTATRPLDEIFGAGELNVYNSYLIQQGGQDVGGQSAATAPTVGSYGWDYKGKTPVDELYYKFEIPAGSTATELSIILAWNAEVTDTNVAANIFTPDTVDAAQNLDLRLYVAGEDTAEEIVESPTNESLSRRSVSTVDNVEHIWQNNLGPGTYTLKVSGAANWDYGLAWRMTTAFNEISADFDEDGMVTGADFLTWQRNFGTLQGASHADGDADGDGDVDNDDLTHVRNRVLPGPPMTASLRVASIPEPAALGLAGGALLAAWIWRARRERR